MQPLVQPGEQVLYDSGASVQSQSAAEQQRCATRHSLGEGHWRRPVGSIQPRTRGRSSLGTLPWRAGCEQQMLGPQECWAHRLCHRSAGLCNMCVEAGRQRARRAWHAKCSHSRRSVCPRGALACGRALPLLGLDAMAACRASCDAMVDAGRCGAAFAARPEGREQRTAFRGCPGCASAVESRR